MRLGHRLFFRKPITRQAGFHRAAFAQMPGQRARIDALNAGNVPVPQIIIERSLRAPTAWNFAQLFDDKSAHVRLAAFLIERVRAVVSDQRIGHRHDLSAIGRIGQHFLITGHRGVETNLADAGARCAERFAFENPTVFESEERAHLERDR